MSNFSRRLILHWMKAVYIALTINSDHAAIRKHNTHECHALEGGLNKILLPVSSSALSLKIFLPQVFERYFYGPQN